MISLRLCLTTLLAYCCVLMSAQSAEQWQTDYSAALEQAGKENKMVLLDFTGSDWCGWCIKLKKDTFSKPEFQKFAEGSLVLVELDFPRKKEQSAELKKQNQELAEKFGIEGFPTLVLLDPQGKEAARNVGYLPGGPEGFVKWVEAA
ncbi:MAG TPA: thioredoxin family protein, partial [Terrimicrobium sp.]